MWESYMKVREREWPQIILCLALVDILGSHEVTSCVLEMAATKEPFFQSCSYQWKPHTGWQGFLMKWL